MAQDTAKAITSLRGLTAKFDTAVASIVPYYPEICTVVTSTGADEEYARLGDFPGMREWLGDRIFHQLRAERHQVRNKTFESSLGIEKDSIDDDRLGMYGPLLEQLGTEAGNHPDELVFSIVQQVDSVPGWDGVPLVDDAHEFGESGAQSNDITFDQVQDLDAITASEFKASFYAGRLAMARFKNDQGKYHNRSTMRRLSSLLCLVPPELQTVAAESFGSEILESDSNIVVDRPGVVATPYLENPLEYFLINRGGPLRPFLFQRRRPLSRQMKGLDDREFRDVKFMCDARYAASVSPAWWTIVRITLEEDNG